MSAVSHKLIGTNYNYKVALLLSDKLSKEFGFAGLRRSSDIIVHTLTMIETRFITSVESLVIYADERLEERLVFPAMVFVLSTMTMSCGKNKCSKRWDAFIFRLLLFSFWVFPLSVN